MIRLSLFHSAYFWHLRNTQNPQTHIALEVLI